MGAGDCILSMAVGRLHSRRSGTGVPPELLLRMQKLLRSPQKAGNRLTAGASHSMLAVHTAGCPLMLYKRRWFS